jgi:CheY-like chemotaxis protein/HPt (histidine-containing phosphotransfer) domain-containing protein
MPEIDGLTLVRKIKRLRGRASTPVIMLTSAGRPEDVASCRELGLAACLTKPVKHSDLLDAIVMVFGGSTSGGSRARRGKRPRAAPPTSLRVLVAEDNPVNRTLVITLLRKRGHRADAVENGREAVAAVERAGAGGFDVVLMDVQMPEMGGFEAATAIREKERRSGGHVPILALTAHTMKGDRERCLAAGMDGYLSKPIDVDQLVATVERLGARAPDTAPEPGPAASDEPFDERAALAHVGGDRRLLKQVVGLFRADYPGTLKRIETALRRRDGEQLRTAAHALKGSVSTFGAQAVRDAAQRLEQMGSARNLTHADESYATVRAGLARLEEAFVAARLARTPRSKAGRRKR